MTDLIVVPQAAHWQRLKRLVLDSVSSPITRRVYNLGLNEFFEWYGREPRPGFTKATVCAWRVVLETRGLGAVSINVRITAVRKLAVEAADNGLLAPELAAGIVRVKGSVATFTHVGIGIVLTRPCLPTRSTMHHRPSRCWTWGTVSAATSDRRRPQPRSTARIARSRSPLIVVASGASSSVCACRIESQLPNRIPLDATPFTRVIPLANSGASSPLSAASTASLRTAVIRTLMETAPSPRASRATRHAHTIAFVNPGRGSRPYHSKNSS